MRSNASSALEANPLTALCSLYIPASTNAFACETDIDVDTPELCECKFPSPPTTAPLVIPGMPNSWLPLYCYSSGGACSRKGTASRREYTRDARTPTAQLPGEPQPRARLPAARWHLPEAAGPVAGDIRRPGAGLHQADHPAVLRQRPHCQAEVAGHRGNVAHALRPVQRWINPHIRPGTIVPAGAAAGTRHQEAEGEPVLLLRMQPSDLAAQALGHGGCRSGIARAGQIGATAPGLQAAQIGATQHEEPPKTDTEEHRERRGAPGGGQGLPEAHRPGRRLFQAGDGLRTQAAVAARGVPR